MKILRPLLITTVCYGGTVTAFARQNAPAAEQPPESTTPASDKEETGALTDTLPDRVELLTLPSDDENGMALTDEDREFQSAVSLFPAELWPGTPANLPEVADLPVDAQSSPPASEALPPEVVASSFGSDPPPALHDPQSCLTPPQTAALRTLLHNSLNARGTFQTSVVVLRAGQQIPAGLNPPEMLQHWHGDNKAMLVVYFFGQPERTQAFFSTETRRHHRSEDLRQIIDFGVREATRLTSPVAQLQRFCYKTAIRLDRLHRQGVVAPSDEPAPAVATSVPVTSLWWAFAVGVQAAALAGGAVWWLRRRRSELESREGPPIRLPDQDWIPRLGASHSGGAGAVIQFGASSQRL